MKKILFWLLLAVVALSAGSCRKAVEKTARKIRIESVEKFERRGMVGGDLTLRVANGSGYKLAIDAAKIDVFFETGRVATLLLREGISIDRRTTASVTMRWQMKISDPLALYMLVKKFQQGDLSQVNVSYQVEGKGGPKRVNISRERVSLSDFLRTFGLSINDVKDYLKE